MRNAARYTFIILLSLLLGTHFLRWGNAGLALTCAVFPVLLAFRRRWCAHVLSLFLLIGAVVWLRLTDLAGRINPFRVRIGDGCDECRACTTSCRYAALGIDAIRHRRPGITCTLCGDCLAACDKRQIHYCFPELTAEQARTAFLVLIAVLHAVFLGVARI